LIVREGLGGHVKATGAALLAALLVVAPSVAAADATTMSFFCTANAAKSKTYYLTEVFTVTADTRDVSKAWIKYIAAKDKNAKSGAACQPGLDRESLEALHKLAHDSAPNLQPNVVEMDWTYTTATPPQT
jgi:hypothetical protein